MEYNKRPNLKIHCLNVMPILMENKNQIKKLLQNNSYVCGAKKGNSMKS